MMNEKFKEVKKANDIPHSFIEEGNQKIIIKETTCNRQKNRKKKNCPPENNKKPVKKAGRTIFIPENTKPRTSDRSVPLLFRNKG